MRLREVARECIGIACGGAAALLAQHVGLGPIEQDAARASGQTAGRAGFDWVAGKLEHHQGATKEGFETQHYHDAYESGLGDDNPPTSPENDEHQDADHGAGQPENITAEDERAHGSGTEELAGEKTQNQAQDHKAPSVAEQPEIGNTDTPEEGEGQNAGTAAQDATEHPKNEVGQNSAELSDQAQATETAGSSESETEDYGYGY